MANIKKLIMELTLEEKASLCSGSDFWHTQAIERLGIPKVMVSDGPHGLRKQDTESDHLGINDSIKAVCFPAGCAVAASFDKDLINFVGKTLGDECQAENVSVLLGPAINIKRSPLCGRNFEYLSEDPFLTGEMAASYINGVQSKNVGTSVKHYLANSQEHRRMTSSSEIDERTLREIYMPGFEKSVKNAQPWSVMCSYNRINGEFASESHRYLTQVLRDEWGFEGFVVSDWGAVNNRVESIKAGLELEMPTSGGLNDRKIVQAVKDGLLQEEVLDTAVERLLNIVYKYSENHDKKATWDLEAHHKIARKTSGECMVLLKNDGVLPLSKDTKVAYIGEFATKPRYQGGGSSHINCFKTTSALEASKDILDVTFAAGYTTREDKIDETLVAEAVSIAENAEIAVIFAGLPDAFESEGYDREHMELPQSQNHLIMEVLKKQPNTIVVLHNGSPVEMPWIKDVKAVLEVYLGGQAVGEATVDVLFGAVNPSGKLPETFPIKLKDNPSYLYYLGEKDTVEYREGVFVGYRYYDKKDIDVLFPFGYGLSYTSFEYSKLVIGKDSIKDSEQLDVSVDVTNTGSVFGKEIVQLYVAPTGGNMIRPDKELKGFEKVALEPGETKTVKFKLDKRSFAYYNVDIKDWHVETGKYTIKIGKSSREICLTTEVAIESTTVIKQIFTINSTVGDIMSVPEANEIVGALLQPFAEILGSQNDGEDEASVTKEMQEAMLRYLPLRGLVMFSGGKMTFEILEGVLAQLNSL